MTLLRQAVLIPATLSIAIPAVIPAQQRDSSQVVILTAPTSSDEIRSLEARWNDAHIYGDTAFLFSIWGEDITVTVPGMPSFSEADLITFWRTGQARVLGNETSDVRIRTWKDAAVVEGLLRRDRNFNGRIVEDHWRFTKTYFRRHDRWEVVSYHASTIPARTR